MDKLYSFKITTYLLTSQWFLLLICLPLNLLLNIIAKLRSLIPNRTSHEEEIKSIQKQIQKWNKIPKENRKLLTTARPNYKSFSTKHVPKHQFHQITMNLNRILELNEAEMTVRVEPYVQIGEITKLLLAKHYTLAVTTEINDATVAGLALTAAIASNSHKMGLFQDNITQYQVILHDGSLVIASQTENVDLFKTLPWSHGSLGFLVALTIKIIQVQPFVKLCYAPAKNMKTCAQLARLLSGDLHSDFCVADFLEVLIFNGNQAVVVTGKYKGKAEASFPVNHLTRWYKPFYYKHVETMLEKKHRHVEFVPIAHYLQRYNRSNFWLINAIFNNFLFRLLFGWLLPIQPALKKYLQTAAVRKYKFNRETIQNLILPIRKLEQQVDCCQQLFDISPLLVYPCKIYDKGPNCGQLKRPKREYLVKDTNYAIYNSLFVFGTPHKIQDQKEYDAIEAMRKIQEMTRKLDGFCYLYTDLFMTRAEFEEMFDLSLYKIVRKKYGADECFPHLFDKIKTDIGGF